MLDRWELHNLKVTLIIVFMLLVVTLLMVLLIWIYNVVEFMVPDYIPQSRTMNLSSDIKMKMLVKGRIRCSFFSRDYYKNQRHNFITVSLLCIYTFKRLS
jgi:hypothetical protein